MMKAAANSIMAPRLRRKSTAALLMTNELRRNSRVSTCSFEQANHLLGPDGLTFYGVNLVPFGNGWNRYNLSAALNNSSRKTSIFLPPNPKQGARHRLANRNNMDLTPLQRLSDVLQRFYEKSRVRYLVPILVLVIYSFLGGAIFYTIENPAEQSVLLKKKEYVDREERQILAELMSVDRRLREMRFHYNASTAQSAELLETFASISTLNKEIRKYKRYAMNRISKAIYWYVLQVYYLNDQETYKSSLLHPSNPEPLWRSHFQSSPMEASIGRIVALRNYTEQLAERCWELGLEANGARDLAEAKLHASIQEFNKLAGLQHTLTPTWTFWNSMFLAVTTYSTIGYGNITPKTNLGKLAAMVYAVIGIPMTFMIMQRLGHFFLLCFEHFWHKLLWLMEFVSCVKDAEKLKGKVKGSDSDSGAGGMPVLLAIGVAFAWMFLCAAIFLKFEKDWDYFKSFYFFFCSLTTIGYGDVTPTNSEDMFIIFGFIIVGLSLVSMCINVIQLKLEALFEELLLTMMEEYVEGEEITATMKPKMSVLDLWRAWKRRRHRRSMQQPDVEVEEMLPVVLDQQQLYAEAILPAAVALGTAQQLPDPLTENNLQRVIKLFPFGKRRREVILRRLQLRLNQHSKGTQTDLCCVHGFRYHPPDLNLLNYTTHELDEEETLTNNSSELSASLPPVPPPDAHNAHHQQELTVRVPSGGRPMGATGPASSSGSSSSKNLRVTISSSVSSSPVALSTSTNSSCPYVRRYLPSNSHQLRDLRRMTGASAQTHYSVQSTPPGPSSNAWEQLKGNRRWTFFESGKTPRGAPRGLAVPYMYTRKIAKTHETTEMRRLIAEIDSRLLDCRTLVSPCSRSVSRTSTATSPSIP